MIGVQAFGAYIPLYRLSRELMGKAWGLPSGPGERAVANIDEDTVTMAVEAGLDCLKDIDPKTVDGLFFASTSAPYKEKAASTIIATTLDLPRNALTQDFTDSLRAGTTAIRAASDAIVSGSAKRVLVVASEIRISEQESMEEQSYGDAAAAVLLSSEDVAAELKDFYSIQDEIVGTWRKDSDEYIMHFEDKVNVKYGYQANVIEAIKGLAQKSGIELKEIARLASSYIGPRDLAGVAKKTGLDPKSQVQDVFFASLGNAGTAQPLISFVAALEDASPGDDIMLVAHGDGADALIFTVTEKIKSLSPRLGVKGHLKRKRELSSYELYARNRKIIMKNFKSPPASPVIHWRERQAELPFYGLRCKNCGQVQYPMVRVCYVCHSKDNFEKVRLGTKGTIYTFTRDFIRSGGAEPVPWCVIHLEDGCRVFLTMTDCDPDEVKINMPVERTFRLVHQGGGFNNYYWKCRPVQG